MSWIFNTIGTFIVVAAMATFLNGHTAPAWLMLLAGALFLGFGLTGGIDT